MRCAWEAYLKILPPKLRSSVDRLGRTQLLELRLRLGKSPQLIYKNSLSELAGITIIDDL